VIPGAFGLLNLIGLAGRALSGGGQRPASLSTGDLASLDFEALLEKAKSGGFASGTPVVVGAGVEVDLSTEQLERITLAADRAAAQGARSAVVLVDGLALKVDVESRRIEAAVDAGAEGLLTGVDTVVTAPPGGAPATGPGSMASNESRKSGSGRVVIVVASSPLLQGVAGERDGAHLPPSCHAGV